MEKFLLDKQIQVSFPKEPRHVVLANNGAYDLEKQGKGGYYVWIGYEHGRGGRSDARMGAVLYQTALEVAKEFERKYGGTAVIENKMASTDMYRVYIEK